MVGYHQGKISVLLSKYQLLMINYSQLILNWLLGSVSEIIPFLCTFSSKDVNNIKIGTRMWNMMK